MDETGIFYRCIHTRAYIRAGQRRQARGAKDLKAKDRTTLVLACNATGTYKIPIAIVEKPQQPLRFKPPRRPGPLPYFSQKSAWMDVDILKSWFETVFLPEVRARTTQPVVLVSDNCGAHGDLQCEKVTFRCASTQLYIRLTTTGPGDYPLSERKIQAAASGPGGEFLRRNDRCSRVGRCPRCNGRAWTSGGCGGSTGRLFNHESHGGLRARRW